MNSLRKWLYKPKKNDSSLLAQFYHADEELNLIASELDSFDGRKDPERCTALVNQLRFSQDKVLTIVEKVMGEVIPDQRATRDFRVKFPDDVLQENLAGQLWFGAECLAAGSSIMNREVESATMRPLAKAMTRHLDFLRSALRDQCLRNIHMYTDKVKEALIVFDKLFAEFELSYVSAMVPVKTMKEYDVLQEVAVLFCETVQRALKEELLCQEMIDDCEPSLMFTIPRLAIVCGLMVFPEGPVNPDMDPKKMSEMFRPFRLLLYKIRELLWTLTPDELWVLEKALCSNEEPDLSLIPHQRPPSLDSYPLPPRPAAPKPEPAGRWQHNKAGLDDAEVLCDVAVQTESDSPITGDEEEQEGVAVSIVTEDADSDCVQEEMDRCEECLTVAPRGGKVRHQESQDSGMPSEHGSVQDCRPTADAPRSTTYRRLRHSASWPETRRARATQVCSTSAMLGSYPNVSQDLLMDGHQVQAAKSEGDALETRALHRFHHSQEFQVGLPANTAVPPRGSQEQLVDTRDYETVAAIPAPPVGAGLLTSQTSVSDSSDMEHGDVNQLILASNETRHMQANSGLQQSPKGCHVTRILVRETEQDVFLAPGRTDRAEVTLRESSVCSEEAQESGHVSVDSSPSDQSAQISFVTNALNEVFLTDSSSTTGCDMQPPQSVVSETRNVVTETAAMAAQNCNPQDCDSTDCTEVKAGETRKESTSSCGSETDTFDRVSISELECVDTVGPRRVNTNVTPRQPGTGALGTSTDLESVLGSSSTTESQGSPRKKTLAELAKEGAGSPSRSFTNRPSGRSQAEVQGGGEQHVVHVQRNAFNRRVCRRKQRSAVAKLKESHESSDTSSYNSEFTDDEEVSMAIKAAENAAKHEARSRFKDSNDLIHRLFVCISGVADQLQTNYAADLRHILKMVFDTFTSQEPEEEAPRPQKKATPLPETALPSPSEGDAPRIPVPPPAGEEVHGDSQQCSASDTAEPPTWVPDEEAPACTACKVPFTIVRRRHHCRNCGKVYCHRCSANAVSLPHYGHTKPVRVCNHCFMFQVTPFTLAD